MKTNFCSKGGKKRIKKINNSPLSFAKNLPGVTPKQQHSGKFSEHSFKQKKDDINSFSLPPAAIDPLEESGRSKDFEEVPFENVTNDQTPLLGTKKTASIRAHPSVYKRQSLVSNIEEGSPLQRAMTARSINRAPPKTYGGSSVPLSDGVPLENTTETGKKEFLEWLDSELYKIEMFYREKEDQAVERFLLLQDQLYQLREQRELLKSQGHHDHSDEILHLGMDEAKTKLQKINKYELPSLPKINLRKMKIKGDDDADASQQAHNRRDYELRKKPSVPYYVARRQIKSAIQEYYRGLELLKSYRMLNRTGFRKLTKKFDKQTHSDISTWYMEKVNANYFGTSDVLDNMIPKVEELFSLYFENGNRKVAIEKLRSNMNEDQFYSSMFLSGILLGISVPLLTYALYLGLSKTLDQEIPEGKHLLQIWAGFFLAILIAILFGVNCYIWTKYKVNYRFIFEFNPRSALDYRQYVFLPSLLLFLFSIFMWFSFNDFWPDKLPARYWPWFFFGFGGVVLILPFDVFFHESRKWLIVTVWRLVLSGLYPVEFRDFFIGDIFCSLTYTMGNISFFFCMYATHWSGALEGGDPKCGSSKSRLMGFFATLPPIWRFLQCLRRYFDSGDWFPHLANMVKYFITVLYYMLLSVYRIDRTLQNRAAFIFFAIVNSVYSAFWDLFMDFSLFQDKYLLRNDLMYPKWFYYFSMVFDVILRFQWIFYALFSRQIQQSAVTSFCIAVAEILRRFIWLLIRMENEHVTNRHLYRASREVPLPYQLARRPSVRYSEDQTRAEDHEANVGYESIGPQEAQQTPATLRSRRESILSPGVLQNVSKAIVNAHAKDFQRRKPKPEESPDDNGSSDDENSDGEDSIAYLNN